MFKITSSDHITQILVRGRLGDIPKKNRPLGRLEPDVVRHGGVGGLDWTGSVPNLHWVECGWIVVFGHIGGIHVSEMSSTDFSFGCHTCLSHCDVDIVCLGLWDECASVLKCQTSYNTSRGTYLSESNLFSISTVLARFPQPIHHLHGFLDTKEVNKRILLIPNNLDNIDIPKSPHFL